MADEDRSQKTEEPTQKRLDEAHRKGQVAKSQDVSHWFMLGASSLAVALFAGSVAGGLRLELLPFLEAPHRIPTDAEHLRLLFRDLGLSVGGLLLLPMLLLAAAAIAASLIQHRPVFATERLKPELSKLSPMKGLERIFGAHGWLELAKAAVKIAAVGAVSLFLIWPEAAQFRLLPSYDLVHILALIERLTLVLALGVLGVLAVIAALDLLYQKWDWTQNQRMSRQEVKDEHRQSEGDPHVKARIRQIRTDRARKRMMAAVPTASVVVTNPTHFAVALKYEQAKMTAPRVVAKGQDLVALRIREIAGENDVPIVENPPLARALYAGVELDAEIPPQFYKAVAEVIGYVLGLKGRRPRPAVRSSRGATGRGAGGREDDAG